MIRFSIIHIPVLDSTNNYIQKLYENENLPEGTIITADEQLKGKGHGKNKWESVKGQNLLFSLLLKPQFIDAGQQFLITEFVSIALTRFLKKIIIENKVQIKWPNDIYVDDKKIGGILIQNTIRGSQIDHTIIGIGLNINQKKFSKSVPNPISLTQITGLNYKVEEVLHDLLVQINNLYTQSASIEYRQKLHEEYYTNLYRFKEWFTFNDGEEFKAMITGINDYGQLRLILESGETKEYGFKEVEFVV